MTDPRTSIRKLLRLASYAGSSAEACLASQRADWLARKYKIDMATLLEAPPCVEIPSKKYDWFNHTWLYREKW